MKLAIAAALLFAAPTLALAQAAPLKLTNPADANRDGVVTDDERADYLAKGGADAQALPVAAPKSSGQPQVFKPTELPPADQNTTAAGAPPAHASEFEKTLETRIRQDRKRD